MLFKDMGRKFLELPQEKDSQDWLFLLQFSLSKGYSDEIIWFAVQSKANFWEDIEAPGPKAAPREAGAVDPLADIRFAYY